jgi:peptidoglycan/xylan/chitin deacetylase (PgdA/CDA1 family)
VEFKKWICIFIVTVVIVALIIAGFNALVDPFGIFGDHLFNWYAYDMTQNPRIAKIAYLDANYEKYDSYIIGCSKTSSYSTEALNRYYNGASFYNMLMYGGDIYDIEMTARYILENYNARNIVINVGLEETVDYKTEADDMKNNLHAKVDGSPLVFFYGKYLLANPAYAVDKIKAWISDGYLVDKHDVFIPETGVYDKSARDVERIGSMEEYLEKYPSFKTVLKQKKLDAMEECLGAVKRIKEMCLEKGATFKFIISPIFHTEMDSYDRDQLKEYLAKLSEITEYWDFSGYNSVSFEPRYFYDPYHFRNAVGDMALARIFGDKSKYVPEDFGRLVTRATVGGHLEKYFENTGKEEFYREVPVLMYHHISDETSGSATVTTGTFEDQIASLNEAGFNAITISQLADYVEKGRELPDRPVLITFDDGYRSNYELAFPILKKYNMPATINVIGVSAGAETYKNTGIAITPHFSYDEAAEMVKSGLISIQSHSYDMHNSAELDENYRLGVYQKEGESEDDYISAFREDFEKSRSEIEKFTGCDVIAYAYPNGLYTTLSEVLLSEMGVKVTFTIEEGMNTVIKGLPQSLRAMKRYRIGEEISGDELVGMLKG